MISFYERLEAHLDGLDPPLTFYKLQFLAGISSSTFSKWKKKGEGLEGGKDPSEADLEKLASVKELNVRLDTLKGWFIISKFGSGALYEGIKELSQREPKQVEKLYQEAIKRAKK